jgi:hypothetical protein
VRKFHILTGLAFVILGKTILSQFRRLSAEPSKSRICAKSKVERICIHFCAYWYKRGVFRRSFFTCTCPSWKGKLHRNLNFSRNTHLKEKLPKQTFLPKLSKDVCPTVKRNWTYFYILLKSTNYEVSWCAELYILLSSDLRPTSEYCPQLLFSNTQSAPSLLPETRLHTPLTCRQKLILSLRGRFIVSQTADSKEHELGGELCHTHIKTWYMGGRLLTTGPHFTVICWRLRLVLYERPPRTCEQWSSCWGCVLYALWPAAIRALALTTSEAFQGTSLSRLMFILKCQFTSWWL